MYIAYSQCLFFCVIVLYSYSKINDSYYKFSKINMEYCTDGWLDDTFCEQNNIENTINDWTGTITSKLDEFKYFDVSSLLSSSS